MTIGGSLLNKLNPTIKWMRRHRRTRVGVMKWGIGDEVQGVLGGVTINAHSTIDQIVWIQVLQVCRKVENVMHREI